MGIYVRLRPIHSITDGSWFIVRSNAMSSLTKGLRSIDIRHWGAVPGRRGSILAVFFVLALVGVLTFPQAGRAQETPPDAPANPMALGGPNTVTLSWDDPAADSITEHQYYQAQVAKLVHPELTADDYFGWSVAVDGDVAVVGAPGDELEFRLPGSAYVFTRESGVWTRVADLTATDGSNGDRFGVSVAVDGDTIVISAKRHGVDDVQHGAVYVFTKPASGWADVIETAKLTASDGADEDRFGAKVALAGNTIVVGAPHDDDGGEMSSVGSAYVYIKPESGWVDATEDTKLTASDGDESHQFGRSVATDGTTVVVGAPLNERDDFPSGSAYVFVRPDGGWAPADETGMLTPSYGAVNNQFGSSIAVAGDYIVVGGVGDGEVRANGGAAYLYAEPICRTNGWLG